MRALRMLLGALALGILLLGEIKRLRDVKFFGGLGILLLSAVEFFLRSRNPELVIEPAVPDQALGSRRQ